MTVFNAISRTLLALLVIAALAACSHDESDGHSHDAKPAASAQGGASEHGGHDDHAQEGRTTIPREIATQSGIRVQAAGPGSVRDEHEVQGLVTPIEGRHARIVARFPGPVREVRVGVGDKVRAGQVLALVESNVSLSNYSITAPFAGTVLSRTVAVGDLASEAPLFELADLGTLWVDLHLFGRDAQHITSGLPIEVVRLTDGVVARTSLDRVLPGTATASQSTVARARIDNADGQWRPGAAVRARVTVAVRDVALVVPLSALQKFEGRDVVFVRLGDDYVATPVELGERDARLVEVLAGLVAGDEVVIEQSYLVKADIEKSGAAHEH
jgi:cobalt-zinc-cadmium efflux system membrane fusion protein